MRTITCWLSNWSHPSIPSPSPSTEPDSHGQGGICVRSRRASAFAWNARHHLSVAPGEFSRVSISKYNEQTSHFTCIVSIGHIWRCAALRGSCHHPRGEQCNRAHSRRRAEPRAPVLDPTGDTYWVKGRILRRL